MKYLIISVSILIITSCVYGPKGERKSKLNYLNGEHYNAPQQGGADLALVPIMKGEKNAPF